MAEHGIDHFLKSGEQPTDLYQLVGLPRLFRDQKALSDAIESAVNELKQHIKKQPNVHSIRRLLLPLATARLIISDEARWEQYDQKVIFRILDQYQQITLGLPFDEDHFRQWLVEAQHVDPGRIEDVVKARSLPRPQESHKSSGQILYLPAELSEVPSPQESEPPCKSKQDSSITIEFGPDGFPVGMPAGTPPPLSSNWKKPSVSPHPPSSSTVEFGPDGFPVANYADTPISQSQILPPELSEAIATDRGQFASTEAAKRDEVDCTVFCPMDVVQGASMMVQVFAHVPEKAEEAEFKAKKYDQQAEERGFTSLGTEIARGSKLLFKLQLDRAKVQPDTQQLVWRGRTASVQFGVAVPKDAETGTLLGTLVVSQDSVPIGTIVFSINIVGRTISSKPKAQIAGVAQRYQKAFISYASQNRNEVLRRIQMLSRVGIETFFDLFSLKAGDAYADKLLEYIDQSDVMFLFWSTAAKKSAWVEKEWRYGLSRKPEGFIQPVIIEGPPAPLPPPELEHLHFNDTVIYFVSESLLTRLWRTVKGLLRKS